jgi:hypothetical protein
MWHRSWRAMDQQETREELVDARDRIAAVAGSPVTTAACPLGLYDRRLLGEMRHQGYTHVFTSDRRPATGGAWLQPRFSVRREDTAGSVRTDMLQPAPLSTRARGAAVGLIKRWR